MEWLNVSSVDELKKCGKNFTKVKSLIKGDLKKLFQDKKCRDKNVVDMITIKSGSWAGLYSKICALREVINYLDQHVISPNTDKADDINNESKGNESTQIYNIKKDKVNYNNDYFINKEAEYIYYLVELDGKERAEKLKITMKCYADKQEAKRWRDSIVKIIHPDKCDNERSNDAICKLNQLYEDMVGIE